MRNSSSKSKRTNIPISQPKNENHISSMLLGEVNHINNYPMSNKSVLTNFNEAEPFFFSTLRRGEYFAVFIFASEYILNFYFTDGRNY